MIQDGLTHIYSCRQAAWSTGVRRGELMSVLCGLLDVLEFSLPEQSQDSKQCWERKPWCAIAFQISAGVTFANVPLNEAMHMAKPRSERWRIRLYFLMKGVTMWYWSCTYSEGRIYGNFCVCNTNWACSDYLPEFCCIYYQFYNFDMN